MTVIASIGLGIACLIAAFVVGTIVGALALAVWAASGLEVEEDA